MVLVLTALVYRPGLSDAVVLDDYTTLQPLIAMGAGQLTWSEVIVSNESGPSGRPVAIGTYVLDWLSADTPSITTLKTTILLLHLLCGALVYRLAWQLLARVPETDARRAQWIALWVGAAWLLAPMLVSTVLYVTQRMAQLAALFTFAGLLCYVMGRDELSTRPRLGWIMIAGVFVGFWPLATLSKENGVLLPLLVALVEWTFFPRGAASKSTRVLRHSLAFVLGLSLLITALSVAMNPGWLVADYTSREFTAAQRLLTQPRVMLDYAANLLLVPGGSALGIYHDDFPVSIDAWTPWTTLPAAALVIGIPLVAVIALIASARRPTMLGLVLFGPTFFIAALLLESTVLPLEMYFEHRAYLPGAGLFLGMGLALMHLPASLRSRRILTVAIVAVPLGYAVTTLERAAIWRSWESVLLASAQTHHGAGRVQTGLASLYINRGDAPRAHEHLNRARTLYRERHRLALALHRLALYCPGTIPAPEETYRTLEAVTGDTVDVYAANALGWLAGARDRGLCRSLDGVRIAEAVAAKLGDSSHTSRTSPVHPRWQMHVHLGRWMASLDRRRDSIAHLLKAFELRPNVLAPGLEAAQLQLSERDFAAARRTLARLRAADTGRIRRQSNLLKSYLARLP